MKTCVKCDFQKEDSEFYVRSDTGKLSGECRTCKEEYGKNYRASNAQKIAERRRNNGLIARYGITEEQYQEMYTKQNGCCAICGKPEDVLHVDHDHRTKQVRGLLCFCCNMGIGYLRDSPQSLMMASKYLDGRDDSPVHVEGHVIAFMRERGKIVPGSHRAGSNIWTNTGREYLALLMSVQTLPTTAFRNDRIAYIGVGIGAQIEDAGVLGLITPSAYLTGQFLAPLDVPPTFPLSPTRTTVRYHRIFAEDEITISPGSTVNISEMGLFTNGRQSDFAVGLRDLTLANASAQSPAAYKALEPVGKKDSLQLEVSWEIRF